MLQRFILLKLIADKVYFNIYFYIILISYTVVVVVVIFLNKSVKISILIVFIFLRAIGLIKVIIRLVFLGTK